MTMMMLDVEHPPLLPPPRRRKCPYSFQDVDALAMEATLGDLPHPFSRFLLAFSKAIKRISI